MKVRKLETVQADIEQAKHDLAALYDEKRFVKACLAEKQRQAEERKRQRKLDKQRLVPLVEGPLFDDITTLELSSRAYKRLIDNGITRVGHLFLISVDKLRWCIPGIGRASCLALEKHLIEDGIAARGGNKVKNAVAVPEEIVAEYEAFWNLRTIEDQASAARYEERQREWEERRRQREAEEAERLRRWPIEHAEEIKARAEAQAAALEQVRKYQSLREQGLHFRVVGDPQRVFVEVHLQRNGKYILKPGLWTIPEHAERFMSIQVRADALELDSLEEATATAEQLLATLN